MTPDAILQVPDLLEKRGFMGAKTASTKWPIGPWTKGAREKRVGELYLRVRAEDPMIPEAKLTQPAVGPRQCA